MKILLDPNIAVLIKDMSDAECAEILRCIFEYPNRDCEIGLWKYIKTQIDRDAQKYKEKCDRALALVEKRKETDTKSITISSTKSSSISCMKSSVIVSSKEKDIDKNIDIYVTKNYPSNLFGKKNVRVIDGFCSIMYDLGIKKTRQIKNNHYFSYCLIILLIK